MTIRNESDLKICVICENLAILCLRSPEIYRELYREHQWMAHQKPPRILKQEEKENPND